MITMEAPKKWLELSPTAFTNFKVPPDKSDPKCSLPSNILLVSKEEFESQLVTFGKAVILSNQCIGYLPLSVAEREGKKKGESGGPYLSLSFSPTSCPFIWSILLTLTQILLTCAWYIYFSDRVFNGFNMSHPTEAFAMSVSTNFVTFAIITRRIGGLLLHKRTLRVWSQIVRTLYEISPHSGVFSTPIFRRIGWELRRMIMVACGTTIMFSLGFYISYHMQNTRLQFGGQDIRSFQILFTVCWKWSEFLHLLLGVWLTFPLRLIQGYMGTMGEELDRLRTTHHLQEWIRKYRRIASLVQLYTEMYGANLLLEILYLSSQILGQTFIAISWYVNGLPSGALSKGIPILLCLAAIYNLTNEGDKITQRHGWIYGKLAGMRESFEGEKGARDLIDSLLKQTGRREQFVIEPCRYFTLNRKLVTSILSTIATFMVVLIQFRETDGAGGHAPTAHD